MEQTSGSTKQETILNNSGHYPFKGYMIKIGLHKGDISCRESNNRSVLCDYGLRLEESKHYMKNRKYVQKNN